MAIDWTMYFWCVVGICGSVLLPVLSALMRRYWPAPRPAGLAAPMAKLWDIMVPYLVLAVFSAFTAFFIIMLAGNSLTDARAALLAGLAWDATLQRLRTG